jgi:hypothetical protein
MYVIQNEKKTLFGRPRYNNEMSIWLRKYEWTHILTLSQKLEDVVLSLDEASFVELVKTFFFRMDEKVYGTGQRASKVKHATFFENKTKAGVPIHFHSHSLIAVEPNFAMKFYSETQKQWTRLKSNGTITLLKIVEKDGGIDGAASYCAKYEHDNTSMFANMEGVRERNILPLNNFKNATVIA